MTKGQVKPKTKSTMRHDSGTVGATSAAQQDESAFADVVSLVQADGCAKGTAVQLAEYIARRAPDKRGFSAQPL